MTKTKNQDRADKARWSIIRILSDGQWHRHIEIKGKAKLSSRTLAKHLNRMTELQIIEKKRDVKSREYPTPVFYRAKRELIAYLETNISELKKRIAELEMLMLPVTRLFRELTETTPEEQTQFEHRLREKELERESENRHRRS